MSFSTLVEVHDLKKYFPVQQGAFMRKQVGWVKAVDGVSFSINRGETVGLVGEMWKDHDWADDPASDGTNRGFNNLS